MENDKTYFNNNNNLLLDIVDELQQIINNSKDNSINKKLGNIINKLNFIINENTKNLDLSRNEYSKINDQSNTQFDELKVIKNQELIYDNGKYIGQVLGGLEDGKGIFYYNNGNRYEGDYRNGKREGKGIYYYNNGDRQIGDFSAHHPIGKHILFKNNGEIQTINY